MYLDSEIFVKLKLNVFDLWDFCYLKIVVLLKIGVHCIRILGFLLDL